MGTSTLVGTAADQIVTPAAGHDDTAVVELHGDIDLAVVEQLRDCVTSRLERGADVVVDLTDVTLIDCASLGTLVQADELADRRGRRMCLAAPAAVVRRTLAGAGLHGSFATYSDRNQALRALHPQSPSDR